MQITTFTRICQWDQDLPLSQGHKEATDENDPEWGWETTAENQGCVNGKKAQSFHVTVQTVKLHTSADDFLNSSPVKQLKGQ